MNTHVNTQSKYRSMSSPRRWHHDFSVLARESFTFQQPLSSTSSLCNWKAIEPINVDEIITNHDIGCIERLLPSLTNAPIGSLIHNQILDPNLRKYLQLAQLGLQYLLFCKKFLEKTLCGLRVTVEETSRDSSKLAKILKKKNEEIAQLQERLRTMENNAHTQVIFSCNKCLRKFTKSEELDGHIRHEHIEAEVRPQPPAVDNNLINTIKLELEVKQLKERLNLAEKELQSQRFKPEKFVTADKGIETFHYMNTSVQTDPEYEVEEINISVKENIPEVKEHESPAMSPATVSDRVSEQPESSYFQKLDQALQDQMKIIETWRQNDRNMYREEINGLQNSIQDVISSLENFKHVQLRALTEDRPEEVLNEPPKVFKSIVTPEPCEIIQVKPVNEGHLAETLAEKSHWEEKFQELEQIFIRKQEEMQKNVEDLNLAYHQKLLVLEKKLKEASKQTIPKGATNTVHYVQPAHTVNQAFTMQNSESDSEEEEEIEEEQVPVDVKVAPVEQKVKQRHDFPLTRKRGSRGGSFKSPTKPPKVSMKKVKSKVPVRIAKTSSSLGKVQENRQTTEVSKPPSQSFFALFKKKLLSFGIKETDKGLSTKSMLKIKSDLATERLQAKKNSKHFSSVRAKINTKANKLVKQKLEEARLETTLTSPDDDYELWKRKIGERIEEETEDSDDTSLISEPNSGTVREILTKAEIYSNGPSSSAQTAPKPLNTRMSYPNLESFDVNIENPKRNPLRTSMENIKFNAALQKILESPIRRPSLPVNFQPKFASSAAKALETTDNGLQPKRSSLKKVNFNSDLTNMSLDKPIGDSRQNFEVSLESCNESDESDHNFK